MANSKVKGQQFPFRPKSDADKARINAAVSTVMSGIEDMLYKLVRKRVRGSVDEDQVHEIVQKCMIWLWEKSLPKYDGWRTPRVKVSTFLFRCAANFINQEVRAFQRRMTAKKRVHLMDPEMMIQTLHSQDTHLDDRIASVADDVLANPEKYLTAAQVKVFKKITSNRGEMMKDMATTLGYQRPSSLSMMMRRIRERILEIDIEGHDTKSKPRRKKRSTRQSPSSKAGAPGYV
jgi:DNA-directed RNA polymerase specialized sigma24 family protein